ncbi:hypothetical protein CFII68_14066 [Pseudomonas sp. CFII68]|nr:hypothetical protein CFII68_14066 [Pseudomonas sp. CFII68]
MHAAHQFYILIKVTSSQNLNLLGPERIMPLDKSTLIDRVTSAFERREERIKRAQRYREPVGKLTFRS